MNNNFVYYFILFFIVWKAMIFSIPIIGMENFPARSLYKEHKPSPLRIRRILGKIKKENGKIDKSWQQVSVIAKELAAEELTYSSELENEEEDKQLHEKIKKIIDDQDKKDKQ